MLLRVIRELALLPGHVTPIVSRRCAQGTEPLGAGDYATAEKAVISLIYRSRLLPYRAPNGCDRLRKRLICATEYISREARDERCTDGRNSDTHGA